MGNMETIAPAPPAVVSRVLATFDRDQLAGFIAVAIDLLDFADGDPDVEPNGDEEDSDGDERGDPAWIEWHTMRGSQKGGHNLLAGQEDDEDDDPAEEDDDSGQCDEDGINTSGGQFRSSGPGCEISDPGGEGAYGEVAELSPDYGIDQTECLPAAMVVASDRQNMRQSRDRIRKTRCDRLPRPRVIHGQVVEYLLRD